MISLPPWVTDCIIRSLLGIKWFVETLLRLIGPLFVVIAFTLTLGVSYVFLRAVLPYYGSLFSMFGLLNLLFEAFLAQGLLWNYIMAIMTWPGSPPKLRDEEVGKLSNEIEKEKVPKKGEGFSRWCKTCKVPKPPRSHHCHVCKRCVLKMDHHCPWINNCVGHNNHKYFVLFLVYLWLACVYCSALSFPPFRHSTDFKVPWQGMSGRGTIMFVFVLSAAVGIALSVMLAWQLYLVLTAQTTIEFYFNRYKAQQAKKKGKVYNNPFDLGMLENWLYFYGIKKTTFWWLTWLLPNKKMGGDGLVYPTRNDAVYPGASDDFDLDALIEEATAESHSPNNHSTSAKKRALVSYV